MKVIKAIKVKIYPCKNQKVLLEKHFGCCRFIYNYALERKIKTYAETKKSVSTFAIQKEIPSLYEERPWLKEVNSQSIQQSVKDLEQAFSHFFKKNNDFPRFKSKHNDKQSFRVPQNFEIAKDKKHIKLPKLKWIRFRDKFNISKDVEFRNITISREGSEYFASICYVENNEIPEPAEITEDKTVGIDMGLTTFATFSDGTTVENPRHYRRHEKELAKQQRILSKKPGKDSKSYQKQKQKVYKIHKKIRNTRKDFLHKLTTNLVENQNWTSYAIEDLTTKTMLENSHSGRAKSIGDAGWRMFRDMMDYKCKYQGKNLLVIGRFEPSSKLCSCGVKNDKLTLEDRVWTCKNCNAVHNRDELAANNVKQFALIKFLKSLGKDFGEFQHASV